MTTTHPPTVLDAATVLETPDATTLAAFLDAQCTGHADCPVPHAALLRLVNRIAALEAAVARRSPEGAEPHPVKWLLDRSDDGLSRSVYVEEMEQRDGSLLFAVRRSGDVLAKDGEWEWEPQPSSRTDDYLARTRYATMGDAIAAYHALLALSSPTREPAP